MRDLDSWLLYCQMHLLEGHHDDAQGREVECACAKLLQEGTLSEHEQPTVTKE